MTMPKATEAKTPKPPMTLREALRQEVHFFYDLQRMRIAAGNRVSRSLEFDDAILEKKHKKWFASDGDLLKTLERSSLRAVKSLCMRFAVWPWIEEVKGVGPTLAGVILSEFDIHRAPNPSKFWAFAGLHVKDGHAPKPEKGKKLPYNAQLRAKLVTVLAGCLLKADNKDYRPRYDEYKHRKQTQLGPCMTCKGTGKAKSADSGKKVDCWNCEGGKLAGRAPWGKSDKHRHQAALRYMAKMFVLDLWKAWREAEGLPVVPPYHEAKQGHKHGE